MNFEIFLIAISSTPTSFILERADQRRLDIRRENTFGATVLDENEAFVLLREKLRLRLVNKSEIVENGRLHIVELSRNSSEKFHWHMHVGVGFSYLGKNDMSQYDSMIFQVDVSGRLRWKVRKTIVFQKKLSNKIFLTAPPFWINVGTQPSVTWAWIILSILLGQIRLCLL